MNILPEQLIVDILARQMVLPDDTIWIRDQNRKIPDDKRLYVVVGMVDTYTLSSTNTVVESGDTVVEKSRVQTRENIQIDIFSRSNEATTRRWEVLTALKSIYSQQQQEENSCKISRLPTTFINSSAAEGGSTLNRFTLNVGVFAWYEKETEIEPDSDKYYDTFSARVDDEVTIGTPEGIIEFEITDGT